MEPESRLFCSASMCKLPIRKGELYHKFRNTSQWIDRLSADGTAGQFVCYRHFSPNQFDVSSKRNEIPQLKKDAIPDRRIMCCRFCLDQSVVLERLQASPNWSNPNELTLQDIVETIGIRINPEEDGIPALICLTCSSKVRYIKRIQRQFQTADLKMRKMHATWMEENKKILAETEEDQFARVVVEEEHPKPPRNRNGVKATMSPGPPDKPVKSSQIENTFAVQSVKNESDIFTEEIADSSSNSVFTIQAMDDYGYGNDGRATDPLGMQSSEDTTWIPPVKKIKEEFS